MRLSDIEADIYAKASLNREHVLAWLTLNKGLSSDKQQGGVEAWMRKLHNDPHYSKIRFNSDPAAPGLGVHSHPINRVLDDLENYQVPA